MEEFFARIQEALRTLKPYVITITGLIALFQLFISATVGGQDRRQTIIQIFGLMAFAALIMYSDRFFVWLERLFR
jgi:hypothetical protein